MPFYEYQCKSCGHALEAMQKVSDPPLKKCPSCGKSQLMRLMSAPVFRLKGAGWYETDFKGEQDKKKNLADRPEADAAKDESKPAAAANAGEAGAPAGDSAKTPEKPADKPAAAPATAAGASSRRSGKARPRPAPARPAAKKTPKKSAAKPKRRA
jgi:putative FmdB family regulatory protein